MMICMAVIFSFTRKNYGQVQLQVFTSRAYQFYYGLYHLILETLCLFYSLHGRHLRGLGK